MVQPRASRRRMIIHSSDNEESGGTAGADARKEATSNSSTIVQDHSKRMKHDELRRASSSRTDSNVKAPRNRENSSTGRNQTKPKSSGKPIYSFFNNATQRLQSSQQSTAQEELLYDEGIEAIQDDSDGASTLGLATETFSKGSSTALTLRKRKFKPSESFESDTASLTSTPQKFRKSDSGDRVSLSVLNEDKRPWTEQFPPTNLSELAVHKKKVEDVRRWIQTSLSSSRRKVLVLKGAAGTGKTTTVVLLAHILGMDLVEWKDTSSSDYNDESYSSSASRFEEFVGRAGASHSLQLFPDVEAQSRERGSAQVSPKNPVEEKPQALLIEEFPNTFSRTSAPLKAFRSTIAQYLATPTTSNLTPVLVIMIISETLVSTNTAAADSFTVHRLLGPELLMHPYLNVIEFNPVAPTFLVKALEMVIVKEARKSGRRKTPGPKVLRRLAETGDIRSAISSLEFLCLRGDDGDTWSSKVSFTKPKSSKVLPALTKSEEEALELISNRESTLGIFHSVGKIVYNKRVAPSNEQDVTHPPGWLSRHRRVQVPETNVDTLIDELGTDISTFIAALHENYALSCVSSTQERTLDSLSGCSSELSDADLLSIDRFSFGSRSLAGTSADGFRQDELCFQVAVRGTMFSLPSPVQRKPPAGGKSGDAHRMFYPASLRLWRKREQIEGKLDVLIPRLKMENGQDKGYIATQREKAGVDSWRRTDRLNDASSTVKHGDMRLASEAKHELILDRLPLMTHILSKSATSSSSRSLLAQVISITQLSSAAIDGSEENISDEDVDNMSDGASWTMDLAEVVADSKSRARQHLKDARPKEMYEGGGLAIPVENRIENLVLADDDIVDD